MELGEWIGGRIIENSYNRGSDNRGSTVFGQDLRQNKEMVWSPLRKVSTKTSHLPLSSLGSSRL